MLINILHIQRLTLKSAINNLSKKEIIREHYLGELMRKKRVQIRIMIHLQENLNKAVIVKARKEKFLLINKL